MPPPRKDKNNKLDKIIASAKVKSTEGFPEPPPIILFPDESIEKLKATSDHSEGLINPTFHQKVMASDYHKRTYGPDTSLIDSQK